MLHDILKKYWGFEQFRPLQEEIIQSVLAGRDTLALLPTGGGKSICFQVPALAQEGMCLVVSPLIALMKDQVENLEKRGVRAAALYSGMDRRWMDTLLNESIDQKLKFLYVSPERLKTENFRQRARQMQIKLLAIDEAHCISEWGHNFRPAYREIARFRELIPEINLIALTASATPEVQEDIKKQLHFGDNAASFQKSFARENLSYACLEEAHKDRKLSQILHKIPGSSIVYVRNRKKTQEIAHMLRRAGITADYYHGGLNNAQRSQKQEQWIQDKIRVMVATNAFGMGIDKPNVRTVIHMDLPESLEAYYQEAGRAGRDGQRSYAVLLYDAGDIAFLQKGIEQQYPPLDYLQKIYQALANHYNLAINSGEMLSFDFDLLQFKDTFQFKGSQVYYALKTLEEAGLIQLNEAFYYPSQVQFRLDFRALYEFQLKHPGAEPILTLLSRLKGGEMQSQFFSVSETTLARYLKKNTHEVEQQLQRLHQMEALIYEKQKSKPQLTFLTPRQDAQKLPLDPKELASRKKRDKDKVDAVVRFAQNDRTCRNQVLLEYFGERSPQVCGICDICRQKQKKVGQTAHKLIAQEIQKALQSGPLAISLLISRLEHIPEKDALLAIRELRERGQLIQKNDGRLEWKT